MMPDDEPKNNSAEPLRGIVLCCTSIPPEKREELASRAEQMGAIHKLDLTSDVTHLIVGATDTPKYKYVAKERPDVKVLSPEWIGAIRKSWLEGEEIDVRALEETHKLPSLAGLKICLTGFDDPLERQHLQRLITVNGASYHADLTKSATHLLANRTEGEKYKYAKLWALRVVAPEWLKDSIGRGMVLEEALYDPLLPSEDRGRDAWVRSPAQGFALGKRRHEETMSAEPVSLDVAGRSRKLRRTTSTKLESQNSTIWNDIVGGGFTAARAETDDWPDAAGDGAGDQRRLSASNLSREKMKSSNSERTGIFGGVAFCLHGFDERETSILKEHLISHGAEVASSLEALYHGAQAGSYPRSYIIVPHSTPSTLCPTPPSTDPSINTVTEWYIERCLHRKSLIDPLESLINQPFPRFPLSDFAGIVISSTGFSGVELMHVSKLVTLIGASYDEYLSPKTSILVCNTLLTNKEKLRHAREWDVPTVAASWLWDSVRDGARKPVISYNVSESRPAHDVRNQSLAHGSRAQSDDGGSDMKRSEFRRRVRSPSRMVLHGCIICIDKGIEERKNLAIVAETLGAVVVDGVDGASSPLTHLIYGSGSIKSLTNTIKAAQAIPDCHMVPPNWLRQCSKLGKRLDETLFVSGKQQGSGPTLKLMARRPSPVAEHESNPPLHHSRREEADDPRLSPICDPHRPPKSSTPLHELSVADLNSPKKISSKIDHPTPNERTESENVVLDTVPQILDQPQINSDCPVAPAEDISKTIADFLARKKTPSSAPKATKDATPISEGHSRTSTGRNPPSRLMGRANSTTSTGTVALSRTTSIDSTDPPLPRDPAMGLSTRPPSFPAPVELSQRISYDDPEMREHREKVLRKVSGKGAGQHGPGSAKKARGTGGCGPGQEGGKLRDTRATGMRTRLRTAK